MSNEHTAGPWVVDEDEGTIGLKAGKEWVTYTLCGSSVDHSRDQANARRIVACVNALDGISTDFLENTTPRTVRILIENTARMERLEAELRQLKSSIEYVHGDLNRLDAAKILEDIEAVI